MDRVIHLADDPPTPHWLAAYAMGLVSSAGVTEQTLEQVLDACGADGATLFAARRELYRLEIFDEDLRRDTGRLLWLAADAATEGVPASASAGPALGDHAGRRREHWPDAPASEASSA